MSTRHCHAINFLWHISLMPSSWWYIKHIRRYLLYQYKTCVCHYLCVTLLRVTSYLKAITIICCSLVGEANIIWKQYQTVFTTECIVLCHHTQQRRESQPQLQLGVHRLVLRQEEDYDSEAIPNTSSMETADQIAPRLARLFEQSSHTGKVPIDWKQANVSAMFKRGDKSVSTNYRPVSLKSVCWKLFHHINCSNVMVSLTILALKHHCRLPVWIQE